MRQQLRALGILTSIGIAAGALTACGSINQQSFEDDSALSGKITAVRLENGSGGVTVNGTDGGSASLHRKVQYNNGDTKPSGATHRIEDGVLILGGCSGSCSVKYTVQVPAGIPVSGDVSSGEVSLHKVGAVNVSASSGDITLEDISGAVKVKTTNGEISGRGLAGGGIDTRTGSGDIHLTPSAPQNVQVTAGSGDVSLTVPPASYKVTVKTGNGDKDIKVPNDPSGKYEIGLKTGSGDVSVKSS
ncbi:DUF4097 domain-containing protein [Streptomyces sp. ASQP_92]|uniref:DUF4097 family beta strand repeat-containing protein n=1 Tax=unclassified Streptomyces TaxID=2593676 RepID=UPI0021C09A75|nr:DUF4097 domain-containing protein [Streptomyces sp. ASQP_92]MCT9089630.1 DUF4097 domain-containing protein [Streptomyces sp. ASQP_92]